MTIVSVTGPSNPQEIRKYLMRRTKDQIVSEYLRQWRYCGELEANAAEQYRLKHELKAALGYDAPEPSMCDLVLEAELLRKERDKLREQNAALMAHVERLREVMRIPTNQYDLWTQDGGFDRWIELALEALGEEAPTTSLSQREDECFRKGFWWGFERARMRPDENNIRSEYEDVLKLRQQSEEGGA